MSLPREMMASRFVRRARAGGDAALRTGVLAVRGHLDHAGTKSAAAISYYALFSVFPLAILTVAVFGLVLEEQDARRRVITLVLENVPLQAGEGRRQLESVLVEVTEGGEAFGVVGVVGLLVAASGVMAAIRFGLNRVWEIEDARPPLRGKLVDLALVAGVGLVVGASFALTLFTRLAVEVGRDLEDSLGGLAGAITRLILALGQFVPALIAFGVFGVLHRFVPARRPPWRHALVGAAVAAAGFEAAKTGFSVYLENFANYSAVYASLAAVVAFLVFVFIAANLFLLGAEVSAAIPRALSEEHESEARGEPAPFARRAWRALKGLVVRPRQGSSAR